uniref:TlpA family protein disulfide reductase n=2 Tax=Flavobacterium sp. TaxID=239 RepID=UPI00404B6B5A
MVNKVSISIFIFLFICCHEKSNNIHSKVANEDVKNMDRKNEVYISMNDTISSFFTNLFLDEMQEIPDMLYIGKKAGKKSALIPTNKSIKILGGNPALSFAYEIELEKGDSLIIELRKIAINSQNEVDFPVFKILNSDKNWYELNFDYLLYKRNIENNALYLDPENKFLNLNYNAEKVYENSIWLLDSLKSGKKISNIFYINGKATQKIKLAKNRIWNAKKQKSILNLDDLGVKFNDENLFDNKEYVGFLREVILFKYFRNVEKVSNSTQFDFIYENETLLNEEAKLLLLDTYLKSIFFLEKNSFQKYLDRFNKINTNSNLKDKWLLVLKNQQINKEKLDSHNLNIGALSNLVDKNELSFEEVLTKHKGKIVLVDFWASWCSPCREEIPFLEKLKSVYNENQLQVIQISIDKDYEAWERASKLENLSHDENSYIITNWIKSNLYKDFKISTIPRYLLFDKNGKIINENAPRPSDKNLVELIYKNL